MLSGIMFPVDLLPKPFEIAGKLFPAPGGYAGRYAENRVCLSADPGYSVDESGFPGTAHRRSLAACGRDGGGDCDLYPWGRTSSDKAHAPSGGRRVLGKL